MRYSYPPMLNPVLRLERPLKEWSISRLLLLVGTPLIAVAMIVMTVSTYRITTHYLSRAYARNAHTRALALAHELEQLIAEARMELEHLTSVHPLMADSVRQYIESKPAAKRKLYAEIAFHSMDTKQNFLLLNTGTQVWGVPDSMSSEIKFRSIQQRERDGQIIDHYVQIDQPIQVYYNSIPVSGSPQNMEFSVIRLSAPVRDANNALLGYMTLSLDLVEIQRTMTLFASNQSPLYIFPQEKERVRSFFFDAAGWLICETGTLGPGRGHISVDAIRTGLQGDVGRPGFESAFRPNPQYEKYWAVVSAVQSGRDGEMDFSNFLNDPANPDQDHFLYYVPIRFQEEVGQNEVIVGGLGCIDSSFMLKSSRYEIAMNLGVSLLASLCLTVGVFCYVNRRISKPIKALTKATDQLARGEETAPLDLSPLPKELRYLQKSMNVLVAQLHDARADTKAQQNLVFEELQRQPVCLDAIIESAGSASGASETGTAYGIVGTSQAVRILNGMIQKAAQVAADVLIIGETGTGKELTAEAIHRASPRANGPFISINCGALDENLLMDALFGHVKGAFTEAKCDRKGAFLAASGGTLHLDEIGNASPKVQQALLRALAARAIKPLGSDQDHPFDAKVIAATNVDLLECARNGSFREDLYYRLAVITITTPPLRDRKEDIPALVRYFLQTHAGNETLPDLSKGALEKLIAHDWPGNIRELKNAITRAMTFAEGRILFAEHVVLGQPGQLLSTDTSGQPVSVAQTRSTDPDTTVPQTIGDTQSSMNSDPNNIAQTRNSKRVPPAPQNFNPRQRKAWPTILEYGGTNRAQYQELVGESVSVRTAQYDLQDLVNKGFLIKEGRGPALKYILVK